ncbi:MAG: hypothetical protein ACPL07_01470, partial [Candidatus Bathyarchaeia archaeon]
SCHSHRIFKHMRYTIFFISFHSNFLMKLKLCPECRGSGFVEYRKHDRRFDVEDVFLKKCPRCRGRGLIEEG